jgi:hypothetical protein
MSTLASSVPARGSARHKKIPWREPLPTRTLTWACWLKSWPGFFVKRARVTLTHGWLHVLFSFPICWGQLFPAARLGSPRQTKAWSLFPPSGGSLRPGWPGVAGVWWRRQPCECREAAVAVPAVLRPSLASTCNYRGKKNKRNGSVVQRSLLTAGFLITLIQLMDYLANSLPQLKIHTFY